MITLAPHLDGRPTPRRRHVPAEEGVSIFIFGDMTIFAVLFATFQT